MGARSLSGNRFFTRHSGSDNAAKPVSQARIGEAERWIVATCSAETASARASRILVTGLNASPHVHTLALARVLGEAARLLLIDTSQGAMALSSAMGLPRSPGLAELCQLKQRFEDVIWRDPDSACHFLPSGRPRLVGGPWGEPGAADRIFRALDESYRYLIFCADPEEAYSLAHGLKRPFSAAVLLDGKPEAGGRPLQEVFADFEFPIFLV